MGVHSPLAEVNFSKQLNLTTWDKPSYACLASRIPYHSPTTVESLSQVEADEEFLRELDQSGQIRGRNHNEIVRLEIEALDIPQIVQIAMCKRVK